MCPALSTKLDLSIDIIFLASTLNWRVLEVGKLIFYLQNLLSSGKLKPTKMPNSREKRAISKCCKFVSKAMSTHKKINGETEKLHYLYVNSVERRV